MSGTDMRKFLRGAALHIKRSKLRVAIENELYCGGLTLSQRFEVELKLELCESLPSLCQTDKLRLLIDDYNQTIQKLGEL